MGPIDALADRLESLPLAVRQHLVGVVEYFKELLLDFNRDYLQKQGQRPDGEVLGNYSPGYAAFKKKYGRFNNTAFIDLKFSGAYLDSFVLDYLGSLQYQVVATDTKAAALYKRYGELLGVREADVQAFVEQIVEPEIREFITRYMQP